MWKLQIDVMGLFKVFVSSCSRDFAFISMASYFESFFLIHEILLICHGDDFCKHSGLLIYQQRRIHRDLSLQHTSWPLPSAYIVTSAFSIVSLAIRIRIMSTVITWPYHPLQPTTWFGYYIATSPPHVPVINWTTKSKAFFVSSSESTKSSSG